MEPSFKNSDWVAARLAAAKPEWTPNPTWARTRVEARTNERPRSSNRKWAATAAAAFATFAIFILLPQGRAVAQDIWYRLFFRGFDAVRVDLSRVPLSTSITTNGMEVKVQTEQEASLKAGYPVHLPPRNLLLDPPELAVTGPIVVKQIVQVQDLRAALAKAGATDVQVPDEWQGRELRIGIGPMVIAGYRDDVQVIQAQPMELHVPADFPLLRFAEAAFRCTGLSWWQARAMAEKFAANPAWLLDIPQDEVVNVEEIHLRKGIPAVLVEDPAEEAKERATVLFATPDRIFAVSSSSRERSIRVANSLP